MSALVDLFNKSTSANIIQARQIPALQVDFFDLTNQFQAGGFQLNEVQNEPTQFTTLAQQYYNYEVQNMTIPTSFIQVSQGINLNRWTPTVPYTTTDALGFNTGF